jgi:alanine racemase
MARPTRAEVSLQALHHNYGVACALVPNDKVMPIVKANAYGHGAVTIARALEPHAPALGVACIEEALALRDAGIHCPILLLEGFFSADELALAQQHAFWLMLHNEWQLQTLANTTSATPLTVWLKLDTGMHRLGFPPQQAAQHYHWLRALPQVNPQVTLATHFASADDLASEFTQRQIQLFREHTASLDAPCSLANSPGLLGWPEARAQWNRTGLMLYGHSPFRDSHPLADQLQPVMTLRSQVMAVREVPVGESVGYANSWTARRPSRIATIPVGYGDGYPRHAANSTPVLIRGQRAQLVGRVSMDMISVDVTDLPPTHIGDEVVLWGEGLPVKEVAVHADTIGYEIVTRLHNRVPRLTLPPIT